MAFPRLPEADKCGLYKDSVVFPKVLQGFVYQHRLFGFAGGLRERCTPSKSCRGPRREVEGVRILVGSHEHEAAWKFNRAWSSHP